MLVLGIDPGTATTGFGLVKETQDGTLEVVDYGVILTSPDQTMPERLLDLHNHLLNISLLHHPDFAAVEKLFFHRNVTTAISVGQARGVILLTMAETGVRVEEYTPLEVKQAIAGYGRADKRQMQEMVRALLKLPEIPRPDDASDALAIAICHLNSQKMRSLGAGA